MFFNEQDSLSRASFLKKLAVAASASLVPGFLTASEKENNLSRTRKNVKSVIFLNMAGGMSHVDTFDWKKSSQFRGVRSSLKGLQIGEAFSRTAKELHRLNLVRSVHSNIGDHDGASAYLHTGHGRNNGFPDIPSFGGVIAKALDKGGAYFPGHITMGNKNRIIGKGGFLGNAYDSFHINNALQPLTNMKPPRNISDARLYRREKLLQKIDMSFSESIYSPEIKTWDKMHASALDFMNSERLQVFDLAQESKKNRERYGENRTGNAMLLVKRLAEAEIPFIELSIGGWDTHNNNKQKISEIASTLDPALAALLGELGSSGLLSQSLVVLSTEFGRTPHMASNGDGRDHFPRAFTTLIGGGGLPAGAVIGSTDEKGEKITADPVSVTDQVATIYAACGIDPQGNLKNSFGRPYPLAPGGKIIKGMV